MSHSRVLVCGVLLLTALLVELAVLARLPLPGATPDLVLLVVVALALCWGPGTGATTGFAAGLALDVVPPADGAIGQWALVLCLVGYVAGLARTPAEGTASVPLAVVAGAVVASALLYAGTAGLAADPRVTWPLVLQMLPSALLYDLTLTPFVVWAVLALGRRADPEPAW